MLKCQKPKNIQSLNSILLVLIKKKECSHSTVVLGYCRCITSLISEPTMASLGCPTTAVVFPHNAHTLPVLYVPPIISGRVAIFFPPPQNKRMEQDQVKPGHRDSKYSCSFGQGQDRANEQMRAGTSWADLCDCGIVDTEPKSVTLLLGVSKMGQAPYTARYTCMQIGQAPYAATSSWGENQ